MGSNPPLRQENQQGSLSPKERLLLGKWEDYAETRFSPRTVEHYVFDVRFLLAWLSRRGVALTGVRTQDLQAYQAELCVMRKKDDRPYTPGSQQVKLIGMKAFFRFLYKRGYVLSDPAAVIELGRLPKRLPRVILSEQEARLLVQAPDTKTPLGLRDRAILETLYATGLRVGELMRLGLLDVDTEERIVRVLLGKGGKDRNVPLTHAAAQAIEAYLAKGRPHLAKGKPWERALLFLGKQGGGLKSAVVGRVVDKWAKRAGIKKRVTCHTFRHTVATHLLRHRADIRHIQALLGHKSLSTTELYTRVEISDLKRVVERAHPRAR